MQCAIARSVMDPHAEPICGKCQKPLLDHGFAESLRCAHALARHGRKALAHAAALSEETVDASTWTHAASARSALEALEQALLFAEEALPELASDDD